MKWLKSKDIFSKCVHFTLITILEFFSKWVKVMLLSKVGEGCLKCVGGGGSMMTHNAGSVTTQSKALNM
jgi:hypothetical protein